MPDQEDSTDFAVVLCAIGGGRLNARLSDQLAEITAAVKSSGKKGVLTLKIEIAPLAKGDTSTVTVTGTSAAKAPERDEDSIRSVWFAGENGQLSRNDPAQPPLPFRDNVGGNR